jgi:dTDP-4-dehydrorhamnose 3,5-epimerase
MMCESDLIAKSARVNGAVKTPPWLFPEALPREASVTADWTLNGQPLISGVVVKEVRPVLTGYGHLVEVWREDWELDQSAVRQVFQSVLAPGQVSAWHAHAVTTDRLYVNQGRMRVVLYDQRPESPTCGLLNQFLVGALRPALIVIPPQVWHGIANLDETPSSILNLVDEAYHYEQPDHWSLPQQSERIPFRW